jgi:beta-lactamase regulating signal transducer with metallopeptidase domain
MIATWMIYAIVVGSLAWAAAAVLERAARALRWQSRWAWVGAMIVTCAWPVLAPLRQPTVTPVPAPAEVPADASKASTAGVTETAPVGSAPTFSPVASPAAPPIRARVTDLAYTLSSAIRAATARLDGVLLPLWGLVSLVLLARLLVAIRITRRARAAWRAGRVDGARVLLSADVGPAVLGVGDLHIVIPTWALDLDPAMRAAMLLHEQEHRRARDPQLLLGAMFVSALMPWNPALWVLTRRLRLAIETDCDHRVLGVERDVERYGSLLLAIAERQTPRSMLLGTALLEPVSNLERRIAIMTSPAPKYPRLVAAGLSLMAALVAFALVVTPAPDLFAQQTTAKAVPSTAKAVPQDSAKKKIVAVAPAKVPVVQTQAKAVTFKTPVVMKKAQAADQAKPDSTAQQKIKSLNGMVINATKSAGATPSQAATAASAQSQTDQLRAQIKIYRDEIDQLQKRIEAAERLLASASPGETVAAPTMLERSLGAYYDFQVDKPVSAAPGNVAPNYPGVLRQSNVEGSVLAQFVVDTDGRVLMETFKEVKSAHPLFTDAVKKSLPNMAFVPGSLRGTAVRQIVQMPFIFTIAR